MPDPNAAVEPSRLLLRIGGWLALLTAVACLAATAAELVRWVLMLRGRTEVLRASVVVASDLFVAVAATCAAVSAVVTAIVAVPVVVRTHRAAEQRLGYGPSRPAAAVLARLIVPGWNLYGAGQVLAEIDGRLDQAVRPVPASGAVRPRPGRLVVGWWCAWVVNGVLVLLTLARAFGGSLQAIADTVELHIAVNAAAVVVAALSAAVLWRFARLLDRPNPLSAGWEVAPPAPTRGGQPSTDSAAQCSVLTPMPSGASSPAST